MASTNDLKNGMVLNLDGQLWSVVWFQHHKPGKGSAVVRTKLKNVLSGKVVDKTFNSDVKVETANVDKRGMTYLYNDGSAYVFMDTENYEQISRSTPETVGDAASFMLENQEATVAVHEGLPLYIELPASVELTIEYTEPGLQGDRSTGGTKPAKLETGYEIAGPALHRQRREGQGRHARRQLPRPCLRADQGSSMGARTKARKRALDIVFESELRGLAPAADARRPAGSRRPAAEPLHGDPRRRRRRQPGRHRRAHLDVLDRLVAGADAGRRPHRASARRVRAVVRRRGAGRRRDRRGRLHS